MRNRIDSGFALTERPCPYTTNINFYAGYGKWSLLPPPDGRGLSQKEFPIADGPFLPLAATGLERR